MQMRSLVALASCATLMLTASAAPTALPGAPRSSKTTAAPPTAPSVKAPVEHPGVEPATPTSTRSSKPSATAARTSVTLSTSAPAICNGQKYCDIKYSDLHQVGAHDAVFVGSRPQDNQHLSVAEQLDKGLRFLQAQIRDKDGTPELCHTSCFISDAGPLDTFLGNVTAWLNAHPWEVVTLLFARIRTVSPPRPSTAP